MRFLGENMKIYSVYDEEFKKYGCIIDEKFLDILEVLKDTPCPDNVIYNPSYKALEECNSFKTLMEDYYGFMPIQLGYCNGHNDTLNCLEYHKGNEIDIANEEFILILGTIFEIENGLFDTSKCKCFKVPKGVPVEIYSTTLHYAPVSVNNNGFRVLICLPKGTNVDRVKSDKNKMLYASNKWLLAHKESNEAKDGAYIGLIGENIKIN